MAIYIVDGKIGSGKTYYCVYSIIAKYYMYDDIIQEYVQKKNTLVVSNIEGLKLDHVDLEKTIEEKGVQYCFSEKFINDLREYHKCAHIVFIIDEFQKWFHSKFFDKDILYFFQYSRHYGLDFYLICQDVDSVCRQLKNLCEYYIGAVSRTSGSGLGFHYKKRIGDETIGHINLKKDKKIFNFYKSMKFDESEKPRPVMYKFIGLACVLLVVAVLLFKYSFSQIFHGGVVGFGGKKIENKDKKPDNLVLPSDQTVAKKIYSGSGSPIEFRDLMNKKSVRESLVKNDGVPKIDNETDNNCTIVGVVNFEGKTITNELCGKKSVRKINGEIVGVSAVRDTGGEVGAHARDSERTPPHTQDSGT